MSHFTRHAFSITAPFISAASIAHPGHLEGVPVAHDLSHALPIAVLVIVATLYIGRSAIKAVRHATLRRKHGISN